MSKTIDDILVRYGRWVSGNSNNPERLNYSQAKQALREAILTEVIDAIVVDDRYGEAHINGIVISHQLGDFMKAKEGLRQRLDRWLGIEEDDEPQRI